MVSGSSAAFERLPTRPPTPPKDTQKAVDEAIKFLEVGYTLDKTVGTPATNRPSLDTPPERSPPSSRPVDSSSRSAKKVDFSPWTIAHGAELETGSSPALRRLPSNRDLKPLKSILKSSITAQPLTPNECGSPAPAYFDLAEPGGFVKMLESVLQLLFSPVPTSRLDGYRTLNGALKTYDNMPEIKTLRDKMGQLMQCIERDISAPSDTGGIMDTSLITQALKLTTVLFIAPQLNSALTVDFRAFVLDRSIEVLQQESVIKAIANHHMHLLAFQKLGANVLTASRAEKIVASLATIHERVSGNSVIAARLLILQRLLEQQPGVMLATIRDWVKHIFHGVLSSIKDIRTRAIDCGIEAGLALGASHQATKAIIDLFNTNVSETSTYGEFLTARLTDMTSDKELGPCAAQIWSMVVLFFRSKKRRLTDWAMFKRAWLLVIQKCLNSADIQTKYEATVAWNRLVYVVNPDLSTFANMEGIVPMLKVPFMVVFDKKGRDKSSKEARHIALGGYCNLLHYAFRPSQSHQDLDLFWKEYVDPILGKLLRSGGRDAKLACRILKALFNGKTTVWNPDVANDPSGLTPEELPRIDCRWIRSRVRQILAFLESYLSATLVLPSEQQPISITPWRELLAAVAEAGRQEVRASIETREAIAHLINLFGRLWKDTPHIDEDQSEVWFSKYGELVLSTMQVLGPIQFTERILSRNKSEAFEAAPTPSHRTSKHHSVLESPVGFLWTLLQRPPATTNIKESYCLFAQQLLQTVCLTSPLRKSRLGLLRQFSQQSKQDTPEEAPPVNVAAQLWASVAQQASSTLTDETLGDSTQDGQRLGHCARDVVAILTAGFDFVDLSGPAPSAGLNLYAMLSDKLKQSAGEGAVVLGLVEPVAEALLNAQSSIPTPILLQYTTGMLAQSVWPKSRSQMDEGRKALWGFVLPSAKHAIFDPYDNLYKMDVAALRMAYNNFSYYPAECSSLLAANRTSIEVCPQPLIAMALRKLQDGLAVWIQDEGHVMAGKGRNEQEMASQVLALWKTILRIISSSLRKDNILLKALENLLVAGFRSSRRSIVNPLVTMWNETFGTYETLEYPAALEGSLRRLKAIVELELPSFPRSSADNEPLETPVFVDSQAEAAGDELVKSIKAISKSNVSAKLQSTKRSSSLGNRLSSSSPHVSSSAATGRSNVSRLSSTHLAKLRHNDSQVEFTAIEFPPLAGHETESQNLTEHQRQVNERQQYETAQMYPDFSSSPAPRSSAAASCVSRLDFSARKQTSKDDYTTPDIPQDDEDPMDGYLGSSPTPKASEKIRHDLPGQSPSEDAEPDDLSDIDIPSSPPQNSEIEGDEIRTVPKNETRDMADEMEISSHEEVLERNFAEEPAPAEESSKEPSVPSEQGKEAAKTLQEQLQNDVSTTLGTTWVPDITDKTVQPSSAPAQESTWERGQPMNDPMQNHIVVPSSQIEDSNYVDAPTEPPVNNTDQALQRVRSPSPDHFSDSFTELPTTDGDDDRDQTPKAPRRSEHTGGGASVVEDSFTKSSTEGKPVALPEPKEAEDVENISTLTTSLDSNSQPSSPSSRKRKRLGGDATPASSKKRQKQTSPIKRIFTRLMGGKPTAGDEIEDCIVVASPSKEKESSPEPATQSNRATASQEPAGQPAPAKRGRGRPRKAATPQVISPANAEKPRQLKRKASALSNVEHEDHKTVVDDAERVRETPAPAPSKSRRTRSSQDARTAPTESASSTPRLASRRDDIAVIIPATDLNLDEYEPRSELGSVSPEKQLQTEQQAAAVANRPIATPKSILQRLKDILVDCKTMLLGSQEHREFSDVLFEVQKEVHDAALRGRESQE